MSAARTQRQIYACLGAVVALLLLGFAIRSLRRQEAASSHPRPAAPARTLPPVESPHERVMVERLSVDADAAPSAFPLVFVRTVRAVRPKVAGFRLGIGEALELDEVELNLPLHRPGLSQVLPADDFATNLNALVARSLDLGAIRRLTRITAPVFSATLHGFRLSFVSGTNRTLAVQAR